MYGLCHVVDIYTLQHSSSKPKDKPNNEPKSQLETMGMQIKPSPPAEITKDRTPDKVLETRPRYRGINCRIINDSIVLIDKPLDLSEGDVICEKKSKKQYNVKSAIIVYGVSGFHHVKLEVKIRRVGDIFAR